VRRRRVAAALLRLDLVEENGRSARGRWVQLPADDVAGLESTNRRVPRPATGLHVAGGASRHLVALKAWKRCFGMINTEEGPQKLPPTENASAT